MPWLKSKGVQLDLAGLDPEPDGLQSIADAPSVPSDPSTASAANDAPIPVAENPFGRAAQLAIHLLDEDSSNPRTEFPDAEFRELAEDIREHGILQPIVVHAADGNGRHLIHFGAKRLRAARRAGITHVPVVIRDLPADPYTQVAENQKRQGLTPLDLARFIKSRSEAGDSNATIAKRLGMNLTSVAHHLALLEAAGARPGFEGGPLHVPANAARAQQASSRRARAGEGAGRRAGRDHANCGHGCAGECRIDFMGHAACPVQRRLRPARADRGSLEQGRARNPRRRSRGVAAANRGSRFPFDVGV